MRRKLSLVRDLYFYLDELLFVFEAPDIKLWQTSSVLVVEVVPDSTQPHNVPDHFSMVCNPEAFHSPSQRVLLTRSARRRLVAI